MKRPARRSAAAEGADAETPKLKFPDWSGAVSEPRRLPWDAIYQRSLAALPSALAAPGFEARRLATKCRVEFVL